MKTILLLPSTALLTKFYCKSEHAHTVFHGRNRKGGSRMWVISNHSRWEGGLVLLLLAITALLGVIRS